MYDCNKLSEKEKILKYWYNLEFFTPFWPYKDKNTISAGKFPIDLPWVTHEDNRCYYHVYLGSVKPQNLIADMLSAIGKKDDAIEEENFQSCICMFIVDSSGTYVEGTFSFSSFIWAVAKVINNKRLGIELKQEEFDDLNTEINNNYVRLRDENLGYNDLKSIYEFMMSEIGMSSNNCDFQIIINKKPMLSRNKNAINKEGNEEDDFLPPNIDMLPNFYASDIAMVRDNIKDNDKVSKYIESLLTSTDSRVEIDNDIENMKKWLSPEKYPLGKWPSLHHPSLMQQIAINLGIEDHEEMGNIFSVNGPPGTGKTTLLKEIIAAYVVQRAILLAKHQVPDDAFEKSEKFNLSQDGGPKFCHVLKKDFNKYGIIVASNNNAAVENISKELPTIKAFDQSYSKLLSDGYFAQIADQLSGGENNCWGFISACFGNQSNTRKLKQALWFDNIDNLRNLKNTNILIWEKAKEKFEKKYMEVIEYRNNIQAAINMVQDKKTTIQKIQNSEKVLKKLEDQKNDIKILLNVKIQECAEIDNQYEQLNIDWQKIKKRVSWLKKMFYFLFLNDPDVLEFYSSKKELCKIISEKHKYRKQKEDLQNQIKTIECDLEKAREDFKKKEQEFLVYNEKIKEIKEKFGDNFADENFWENIHSEKSQTAAPWTNVEYDKLRVELFCCGLELHEAFILCSKKVKENINSLVRMWNKNSFSTSDSKNYYANLLNTLMLVVPVLSTTFASVSRCLEHVGKDALGTLIIDEAGQATPYSALGALWRTSKAIIVGDPMQVEPIMSVPQFLCEQFIEEFKIDESYRGAGLSVQQLADKVNVYGGYRFSTQVQNNFMALDGVKNKRDWVGCPLLVHRRCVDPMFSIANSIAYNDKMINKSLDDDNVFLSIEKSLWVDVKGEENGEKDHFVKNQGDIVVEMVCRAFEIQYQRTFDDQNIVPSLYVISPFKSVISGIKDLLKGPLRKLVDQNCLADARKSEEIVNDWLNSSCGTVHTFQGKEANEVILVLGCDENSGQLAADWAGQKPNILNVALTRAKYRIAIIGDSDLWKNVSNFSNAYKVLKN